ncbi:hypothetical protein, partial [Burkholderia multivorans]|uniref:hypothetical protein n=1 Tax=Burkholderia multivorans TaxID=87883 RepID=UPI001C65534F
IAPDPARAKRLCLCVHIPSASPQMALIHLSKRRGDSLAAGSSYGARVAASRTCSSRYLKSRTKRCRIPDNEARKRSIRSEIPYAKKEWQRLRRGCRSGRT